MNLHDPTQRWSAVFYHLTVINRREWSPAKSVRVIVTAIAKRLPDGTYRHETNVLPLQLTWIYSEVSDERKPTIASRAYCDLGFLDEHEQRFILSTYVRPLNYPGSIGRNESMRVETVVEAENGPPQKLAVEITWDGRWKEDEQDDLTRHLIVKEIPAI